MSLRNEQCRKVCRIIDDALANRPAERDSLIIAVQIAFETLERMSSSSPNCSESPNGWMPCEKKLPEKSEKYEVTIKNVTTIFDGETGEVVERVGYYVDCDIYKSYLLRKWHRYDGGQVITWRKLPEPYQPRRMNHETNHMS